MNFWKSLNGTLSKDFSLGFSYPTSANDIVKFGPLGMAPPDALYFTSHLYKVYCDYEALYGAIPKARQTDIIFATIMSNEYEGPMNRTNFRYCID